MKKLFLLIFLFIPAMLFAQESERPFKKADLIIIETSKTPDDALKQLAKLMQDYGYSIIRFDKELNSFLAQKPESDRTSYTYQVQAFIREKDGVQVHLFGNYKLRSEEGETLGQASFKDGILNRIELDFFQNLDKIAKAFPGGRVKYSKLL